MEKINYIAHAISAAIHLLNKYVIVYSLFFTVVIARN